MITIRSFRRSTASLAVGVLAVTSCGADQETISKADFLTEANAICRAANDEIEAAPNGFGPTTFLEVVIPTIRQGGADMRALGFPAGDEELLDALLTDQDAVLDELEALVTEDPDAWGSGPNPFAELNTRLDDYGLNDCAGG